MILGLLFSIEVTSTYYPVRNYVISAWAATFSGFTYRTLWNWFFATHRLEGGIAETYFLTELGYEKAWTLVGISVLMACVGTILGTTYITITLVIIHYRRKWAEKNHFFRSPYYYSILVVIITSIALFPGLTGSYMALPLRFALQDIFSVNMEKAPHGEDWTENIYVALALYGTSRLFLNSISVSLPIPCGLFFPCLVAGTAFGRLVGEALTNIENVSLFQEETFPAMAAVLGGAAVITVITQTFSAAIIMAELTGRFTLFIPLTVKFFLSFCTIILFAYFLLIFRLLLLFHLLFREK